MAYKIMFLIGVVAALALGPAAAEDDALGASLSVDSVGITVEDMDRAIEFYSDVLAFTPVADVEIADEAHERLFGVFGSRVRMVRMQLGAEAIELIEFLAPRGRPLPVDSRSNDGWFQHVAIIVSDIDRAYRVLRDHNVEHASSGPQRLPEWNPNAGGIAAFYFRDPDGNHLEILQFPPGKGQARWQATDRLFLGIDHTAIVVGDTERSLGFYRDTLGMRIVGTSENYGPEQERLNNVFGVRLRITALAARNGIGVELLEYLAPRTGRAMPVDTQSNDAWHWQVNFAVEGLAALDSAVRDQRFRYVSPGIVTVADPEPAQALLVRDPDGHAAHFRRRLQ
jgi:catechol 2,3-dioxygenase-like lactoylglutathione lyase family enzyme